MNKTYVIAGVAVVAIGGAIAMAIRGDARGERVVDPVTAARERAEARRDEAVAEELRARKEMQVREQEQASAIAAMVAGVRPGQPGPFFDAIHFGSAGLSASVADVQKLSDDAVHHGFTIGLQPEALDVSVPSETAHAILHEWGDPPLPIHDAASHTVMTMPIDNPGIAQLEWRPYETLAHVVDPGDDRPGSTPFSIVGAKLDDLALALGRAFQPTSRGQYTWSLPPFQDGSTITATVEAKAGVITSVTVNLDVNPDDVARALRDRYGDAGAMHLGPWKHGKLEISIVGHPPDGATVTATLTK